MKRILALWCLIAAAIGSIVPAHAASTLSPSTMRIVSLTATPRTVSPKGTVSFTARVRGMTLDFHQIGKPPTTGHGHLQYYLDRIPADAYRRADLRHSFLGIVATPIYIFSVKASPVKFSPGKHQILVALARNNDILYHAPVASITITVK